MFQYSEERKNAVIRKMLSPEAMSISELSRREGISKWTLYSWRKQVTTGDSPLTKRGRSSSNLSAEAKFAIVVETATLSEVELSRYCREKGLFPEQVKAWKQDCIQGAASAPQQTHRERAELQKERQRNKKLERELRRKEKALAETAALLVLRKKADAIWGDSEDE